MKKVQGFVEPLEILSQFEANPCNSEMSKEQVAFLCGLIKKKRPKKIVEIGIASGGTTSVILQCVECLGLDCEVFSVDINEYYYNDQNKRTGFLSDKLKRNGFFRNVKHTVLLGKYLPQQLPVIGNNIDFVILDTVHYLPGELLDYLAIVPMCAKHAFFILHDIDLCHYPDRYDGEAVATGLLYSLIYAKKYVSNCGYTGIAGFELTEDNFCDNVFFALNLKWAYWPGECQLNIYKHWFNNFYSFEMCSLFQQTIEIQRKTLSEIDFSLKHFMENIFKSFSLEFRKLYLYGSGKRGKALFYCMKRLEIDTLFDKIDFVVSDEKFETREKNVKLSSIVADKKCLVVLSASTPEIRFNIEKTNLKWIELPGDVWRKIENMMEAIHDNNNL